MLLPPPPPPNYCTGDRETSTTLPQDPDADKAARLKQLEEKREDYRWSTEVNMLWKITSVVSFLVSFSHMLTAFMHRNAFGM